MSMREKVFDVAVVDKHLDAVLRASGSGLKNYSLGGTLAAMRSAMNAAMQDAIASRLSVIGLTDGSHVVVPGWQPAETAPKWTGSGIPPYVLISDGSYVLVGYRAEPNYPDDPEWCEEGGDFIEPQPTHWMPRPAPPLAASQDAQPKEAQT